MRYTLSFKVKNSVIVVDPIPIKVGNASFFVTHEDNRMKSVGMFLESLPSSLAPRTRMLDPKKPGDAAMHIHTADLTPHQTAITDSIRAWQATLAPLTVVELDYHNPTEAFSAEEGEPDPGLYEITSGKAEVVHGFEDFGIYARAFLLSPTKQELVEPMVFYVEGMRAFHEERLVYAYNSLFLFLESMLGDGKFKEKAIVDAFMASPQLLLSLREARKTIQELKETRRKDLHLSFDLETLDDRQVFREIVLLRGKLRHHSIKNKGRWNPQDIEAFRDDVYLLSLLSHGVCKSHVNEIFSDDLSHKYLQYAEEWKNKVSLLVEVTFDEAGAARVVPAARLNYPQKSLTAELAITAMQQALNAVREKFPDKSVLACRIINDKSGVELCRYAIGGGVSIISRQ